MSKLTGKALHARAKVLGITNSKKYKADDLRAKVAELEAELVHADRSAAADLMNAAAKDPAAAGGIPEGEPLKGTIGDSVPAGEPFQKSPSPRSRTEKQKARKSRLRDAVTDLLRRAKARKAEEKRKADERLRRQQGQAGGVPVKVRQKAKVYPTKKEAPGGSLYRVKGRKNRIKRKK